VAATQVLSVLVAANFVDASYQKH